MSYEVSFEQIEGHDRVSNAYIGSVTAIRSTKYHPPQDLVVTITVRYFSYPPCTAPFP